MNTNTRVDLTTNVISLTLWHGLHYSMPRHPLLWYDLNREHGALIANANTLTQWTPLLGAVIAIQIGVIFWRLEALLLMIGLITGLMAATGINGRISREREQGRYDLMGLTPSGVLGASWVLATRFFSRDPQWKGTRETVDRLHLIWVFGLFPVWFMVVVFIVINLPNPRYTQDFITNLLLPLNATLLLIISRADFQYSIITGAFLGMIAPTFAGRRLDSYMLAIGTFLLIRFATYALVLTLGALIIQTIRPDPQQIISSHLISLVWTGCYLVIHEIAIHLTCRALAWRMNSSVQEICEIYRRSI